MTADESNKRVSRDDLDECWCCGGLHDGLGLFCPDCRAANCQYFDGECRSDHKPVLPDGGRADRQTDRVMVDIETLGTEPGSVILSIGAVTFSVDGIDAEFYREINLQSCQDAGLEIDADTLDWWLGQDESVRDVLTGGNDLADVLRSFNCWYPDGAEVWANSPAFDCAHLERAYDAVGEPVPWEYYQQRDVRTLKELPAPVQIEMNGEAHNALDDAKYQARLVGKILGKLQNGDW